MTPRPPVDYGHEIESAIAATRIRLAALPSPEPRPGSSDPAPAGAATRWTAISLLEGDPRVREAVAARPGGTAIVAERDELERHLQDERDWTCPCCSPNAASSGPMTSPPGWPRPGGRGGGWATVSTGSSPTGSSGCPFSSG